MGLTNSEKDNLVKTSNSASFNSFAVISTVFSNPYGQWFKKERNKQEGKNEGGKEYDSLGGRTSRSSVRFVSFGSLNLIANSKQMADRE